MSFEQDNNAELKVSKQLVLMRQPKNKKKLNKKSNRKISPQHG